MQYALDTDETQVFHEPAVAIPARKKRKLRSKRKEGAEEEEKTDDELVQPVDLHDDQAAYLMKAQLPSDQDAPSPAPSVLSLSSLGSPPPEPSPLPSHAAETREDYPHPQC